MVVFLWFVFGVTAFMFNLLVYMLVVYIHGEHPDLYKELGKPSAFHFLVKRPSYFSHPFTAFILKRQYCKKLQGFHGLLVLSHGIFGMLITAIVSAFLLGIHYA